MQSYWPLVFALWQLDFSAGLSPAHMGWVTAGEEISKATESRVAPLQTHKKQDLGLPAQVHISQMEAWRKENPKGIARGY